MTTPAPAHYAMHATRPHIDATSPTRSSAVALLAEIATASVRTSSSSLSDKQLCGFRGAPCKNPRAVQPNGECHALCEFHRRQTTLSHRQRHLHHRTHTKTLLFRDPSRVPATLLTTHQAKAGVNTPPRDLMLLASSTVLPRLRSNEVLRRALMITKHHARQAHAQHLQTAHTLAQETYYRTGTLPTLRSLERLMSEAPCVRAQLSPISPFPDEKPIQYM